MCIDAESLQFCAIYLVNLFFCRLHQEECGSFAIPEKCPVNDRTPDIVRTRYITRVIDLDSCHDPGARLIITTRS